MRFAFVRFAFVRFALDRFFDFMSRFFKPTPDISTKDRSTGKNEPDRSALVKLALISNKVGVCKHRFRQVALRQVAIPHVMTSQIDLNEIDAVQVRW